MPLYRDEAIVLRTQKLGEADRIITLLTRSTARCARSPRACAAPSRGSARGSSPSMVVDVQCYEGRNLDTVTQAETLAPYGDAIARDYAAYTAATAMLETAERLTEEREPAVQQFLLLAGALRSLAERRARARAGARRLPAALARRRRLGAELPRLRAVRRARARTGRSTSQPAAPCAPYAARPARRRPPPETLELLASLLAGDWEVADASEARHRREGSGLVSRLPAVAPRARAAFPAPGRAGLMHDACPSRPAPRPESLYAGRSRTRPAHAAAIPADLVPRHVADRHGRQRPVGQRARPAAHQGPRGGGGVAARRRRRRHRDRRDATCRPTRSRPRTGGARPTRCASSWASTATSSAAAATSCTSGACGCAGSAGGRGCGAA